MSGRQPEGDIASRWRREAREELRAAAVVAARSRIGSPGSTHLAAEKALKSMLIDRGVEVPRIHDLIGLRRLLPEVDQARFDPSDLELLNPWTIEGRYPADLPDVDDVVLDETLAAARRIVTAVSGEGR